MPISVTSAESAFHVLRKFGLCRMNSKVDSTWCHCADMVSVCPLSNRWCLWSVKSNTALLLISFYKPNPLQIYCFFLVFVNVTFFLFELFFQFCCCLILNLVKHSFLYMKELPLYIVTNIKDEWNHFGKDIMNSSVCVPFTGNLVN